MFNRINRYTVYFILICLISIGVYNLSYAQSEESEYSVNAYLGLGYGIFISELDFEKLNKSGFLGTVRIMWEPEHLLSVGLESGYLQLYKLDSQQVGEPPITFGITSSLDAVPIIAVLSMKIIHNLKLSVGSGVYILYSRVDALDNPVKTSQLSTGSYFAASYFHTLSRILSLGGEIKYYYINKIEDGDLTFQIALQYKFFTY